MSQDPARALGHGADALRRAHEELVNLLEDLEQQLDHSVEHWEDHARSAYREVRADWLDSTARQHRILQALPDGPEARRHRRDG